MPAWPINQAPAWTTAVRDKTITAGDPAHTKGAWTELMTVDRDTHGLYVRADTNAASTADTAMLLDIGVGSAGSEQVVLANYLWGYNALANPKDFDLPLFFPAGSRIAARTQAATALRVSTVFGATAYGSDTFDGQPRCYSHVDTYGSDTATSSGIYILTGPTLLTWTNWIEVSASWLRDTELIMVSAQGADNTMSSASFIIQVGVGAAGSEIPLGAHSWYFDSSTAEQITHRMQTILSPVPQIIRAGQRVCVRAQANTGSRDISVAVHGIG